MQSLWLKMKSIAYAIKRHAWHLGHQQHTAEIVIKSYQKRALKRLLASNTAYIVHQSMKSYDE